MPRAEENGVPGFLPIGGPTLVRQTSSTHGAHGYITTDPAEIEAMNRRLQRKIEDKVEEFTFAETLLEPAADTLLVTYGVTARAARAACRRLKEHGRPVSLLVLKTLWPVPEALIRRSAAAAERVVVVEMNLGQYVHEIRRTLGGKRVDFLGRMDGQLIKPARIEEEVARD